MEKEKINIIIALITGVILIIISSFYVSLTDEVYLYIGKYIGYKWLINIILLLVLIIFLIKYYYKKTYHSSIEKELSKINLSENQNEIEKELSPKEVEETYKYILKNLSREEKELLKEYIDNDTKTRRFSINNGVAMGLKSMNVLYISSNISRSPAMKFPFNLQPWAWEMLKENPKYLKI